MFASNKGASKSADSNNFKESLKSWISDATKRKLLINIALFGVGVYISSAFTDLTFEAPLAPPPGQ